MDKIICSKCGSTNVEVIDTYRKTVPPKNTNRPSLMPPRRVTYGYKIDKFTCECGNIWGLGNDIRGKSMEVFT